MNKSILTPKKIGVIGLGRMGSRITTKFLNKNYTVYVYEIDENTIKKISKQGAIVCHTPSDVAKNADIIIEVTPNDISSREVWKGNNGILHAATPQKYLITCSTLSAEWIDELSETCTTAGYTYFDMPMMGGYRGLNLYCGGDKAKLEEIKPILRAFAGKIVHLGKQGQGIRYKLILNFMQAVHRVAFGQALKVALQQQMDVKKVGNALVDSLQCGISYTAWDDFQHNSDDIYFTVELITKDLTYGKQLTKNLDLSLLEGAYHEYLNAIKKGYSKKDWSIIDRPEYIQDETRS